MPVIIGGDFNSLSRKGKPDQFDRTLPSGGQPSGVYELLSSGELSPLHPDHPWTRRGGATSGSSVGLTGAWLEIRTATALGEATNECSLLAGVTLDTSGLRLKSSYHACNGWEPPLTTKTDSFAGCVGEGVLGSASECI